MKLSRWIALLGITFILMTGVTDCTGGGSNLDFFRNKTVTIIVPYGAGGGLDVYARAIAPFLQKYLPGSKVEVQNITEGGGTFGKNLVFAAQPDGLTLGFTPISGALLAEWEGNPRVQYKTAEFSYIGRINAEAHVMVVSPKSGLTTLDDIVQAKKIRMGFTGMDSDDYYVAQITASLLGYQVEARTDFLSADDAGLACVKGEIDAILFSDSNVHRQIEAQTVAPIVIYDDARLDTLPDVPTIFEVVPADKQQLMQALVHIYALDRVVIAPPNMPADRLKVLREALDKVMADPEFQQNMVKIQRPVDYLPGDETAKLLQNILSNANEIKPLILRIARESR